MTLSVVQVIGNSAIGGAERHLFDLVRGLASLGVDVSVICPRPGPLTEQLAEWASPSTVLRWFDRGPMTSTCLTSTRC